MYRLIFRSVLLAGWLALICALSNAVFPLTSRIDLAGRDMTTRARVKQVQPPPEIDQILLIALDDETLRISGQRFPFPRWLHAQAIDGFMSVDPRAVAYDFVFGGVGYTADEDVKLKESLARAKRVVLASYIGADFKEQGPNAEFLSEGVVKAPINKIPGPDGIARSALPYYVNKETGEEAWGWELEALFQAGLATPDEVGFYSYTFGSVAPRVKKIEMPVSPWNFLPINFMARPEDFKHVSFWRFLSRDLESGIDYSKKIFLVGNTSKLSHDKHPTPFGEIDGLYLNANALLTMLSGRYLRQVPTAWQSALLLLFLIPVLAAGLSKRIVLMTFFGIAGVASFLFISVWALWHDVLFDLYYEAIFILGVWFIFAVYRQVTMALENVALREEAIHDPLTGFFTRRYMSVRLKYDLQKLGDPSLTAKRKGSPGQFALAMVDLDNFKAVNDTFGHAEGDRTLRTVAEVIRKHVRREDIVCRYGGDEFCIIMAGTNAEGGAALLERVRQSIVNDDRLSYTTKGNVKSIRVTASFGVAAAKWSPDITEHMLIKIADRALYEAKKAGRNRIVIASDEVYEDEAAKTRAEAAAKASAVEPEAEAAKDAPPAE